MTATLRRRPHRLLADDYQVTEVVMENTSGTLATPGGVFGGQAFSTFWQRAS